MIEKHRALSSQLPVEHAPALGPEQAVLPRRVTEIENTDAREDCRQDLLKSVQNRPTFFGFLPALEDMRTRIWTHGDSAFACYALPAPGDAEWFGNSLTLLALQYRVLAGSWGSHLAVQQVLLEVPALNLSLRHSYLSVTSESTGPINLDPSLYFRSLAQSARSDLPLAPVGLTAGLSSPPEILYLNSAVVMSEYESNGRICLVTATVRCTDTEDLDVTIDSFDQNAEGLPENRYRHRATLSETLSSGDVTIPPLSNSVSVLSVRAEQLEEVMVLSASHPTYQQHAAIYNAITAAYLRFVKNPFFPSRALYIPEIWRQVFDADEL